MSWEAVIGLEVHAQLATHTKIFSRQSAAYGAGPNEHVNEVCAGMPGVLPVLNRDAVHLAMKAGAALGCTIHRRNQFDRKHYFYPDLPKGYQISQFTSPICTGGKVTFLVDGGDRTCTLTRIHMEEDAGKSTHRGDSSLVDLNRAGTPLIEIVSEPELRTPEEASSYLRELRNILRYIEVCDGNMEEGSFRCDANVSVRRVGAPLGTRAEVKNLNSFRFVQRAIQYEIDRQIDLVESGGTVVQETRLYNADTGKTFSMRSKEDAHDYRYFPDPDLPPLVIDEAWETSACTGLPELPAARRHRYKTQWGIALVDARTLTANRPVAEFFEAAARTSQSPKRVANWVINDVLSIVTNPEAKLSLPFGPGELARLVDLVETGEITGKIAKTVFGHMAQGGGDPVEILDREGLRPVRDEGALRQIIQDIVATNPAQAEELKGGKTKLLGFFIGQAMRLTQGKADPAMVRHLLKEILGE
jgi:aspartyl-tRNA(Asn)/glutamyl-tRNA(Gln) amidotransferase subunit B